GGGAGDSGPQQSLEPGSDRGGAQLVEQPDHLVEQRRVGGEDRACPQRSAVDGGDPGASLLGDEGPGGDVPGGQPDLEVDVDPPGGDRAQVESGGAHPPDVADAGEQLGDDEALAMATGRVVGE